MQKRELFTKLVLTAGVLVAGVYLATIPFGSLDHGRRGPKQYNNPQNRVGALALIENEVVDLEALAQSDVTRQGSIEVNGMRTSVLNATTSQSLKALLAEFYRRAERVKAMVGPLKNNGSMSGTWYRTEERFYGLVAYALADGSIAYQLASSPNRRNSDQPLQMEDAFAPPGGEVLFSLNNAGGQHTDMQYWLSDQSVDELIKFYLAEMGELGWRNAGESPRDEKGIIPMLFFKKGQQNCMIGFDSQGVQTTVSVMIRQSR